jgi:hypothetical protein
MNFESSAALPDYVKGLCPRLKGSNSNPDAPQRDHWTKLVQVFVQIQT